MSLRDGKLEYFNVQYQTPEGETVIANVRAYNAELAKGSILCFAPHKKGSVRVWKDE